MLERDMIGHKHWTKGFLCEADVSYLESLDPMRGRNASNNFSSDGTMSYEQIVGDQASDWLTHCEHGVPLHEPCVMCRDVSGSDTI